MTNATSKSSRKPELIFCIAAYNAASTFRDCLQSIKPYADRIVVVEGRFGLHWRTGEAFKHPHSTDNTLEIAEEFGCEIIVSEDLPQHKQRDLYLVGQEGDVYFVIDADMVLDGDLDKEQILFGNVNVWGVSVYTLGRRELMLLLRRHIGSTPHHNVGQLLIDGYGVLMDGSYSKCQVVDEFWLRHIK